MVGKLTEGTFVRVLERRTVGDGAVWVRIEGDGLNGWVNQRLLHYGQ